MLKNQILVFSLIGRETMLMKRCVLIGLHISTSFPVKKLRQKRDFSEDEYSAALVEALRNFHYDSLEVEQIEYLKWVLIVYVKTFWPFRRRVSAGKVLDCLKNDR